MTDTDAAVPPPPRTAVLGPYHLTVLGPDCVEEDFQAVTSSELHLLGLFGSDWPRGLTLERNLDDLIRHAREFDEEIAFAWVLRDNAGTYLGCLYLDPDDPARSVGQIFLWLQASQTSPERVADIKKRVRRWTRDLGYDPETYPIISPEVRTAN